MDIPPTARAIALLIASTPAVQDAQIGVLQQLLEFSHRYTSQVLSDALVYADHAGRSNKIEAEDVSLAVQARVGWEFGGRVPKDFITSLATQTNAQPLPSVPETFGLRLPPSPDCLTSVDFDLHPNRPPPAIKQYDEEIEEIEESGSEDDDEDMEPAQIPDEEDGLFGGEGGDDEESGGEEGLEEVPTPAPGGAPTPNGVKRKLVEDDDYD
ncbi:TFIID-domain-containing protein [Stereum hirsutum FP-91666 SS1]|uniref:TFIID-domain-containing protein n=1 Tax=Stereum hirsutum (strain FP-91666) TaxID=721885 RepID=UPI000440C207|nr:TFIID-domain-containing protein [Stereum hirsutum FP-91666 SS1]EIM88127.1 TFIID-domain-containing protein [Stereum hirsutum FP-91666 SS1]